MQSIDMILKLETVENAILNEILLSPIFFTFSFILITSVIVLLYVLTTFLIIKLANMLMFSYFPFCLIRKPYTIYTLDFCYLLSKNCVIQSGYHSIPTQGLLYSFTYLQIIPVCMCVCVCNINSINFLLCGYLHGFKYFVTTNIAILYYRHCEFMVNSQI